MNSRFENVDTKLNAIMVQLQELKATMELDRRLARLEAKQPLAQ